MTHMVNPLMTEFHSVTDLDLQTKWIFHLRFVFNWHVFHNTVVNTEERITNHVYNVPPIALTSDFTNKKLHILKHFVIWHISIYVLDSEYLPCIRVYPKVSTLSYNEINNKKHSLRSNTRGYGSETH